LAKYKVVIVGGGFGGIKAALKLCKNHKFEVTLISDHPDFRYYPTLYETATGRRGSISSIPLKEIFSRLPINLVQATAENVDRHNRTITTTDKTVINYDALILALGVKTNYFHIEGLEEYSYGIKSQDDAQRLKDHLHKQIIEDKKPDLNYVIVGGGPTGIELAGVLPHYIRKIMKSHDIESTNIHVDLVEAAPRLLPRSSKKLSKKVTNHLTKLGIKVMVGAAVQAESADTLTVNRKPIRSHTVIWTAGVTNNPFYSENNFQLSDKGKVRVDQYLQAEPGIYVIGDNADTPFSGMAQTAIHDGNYIADNLIRMISKKTPKIYKAKRPIYVFSAGDNWAAVDWSGIEFFGILGNWIRRLADLDGFHNYEPLKLAAGKLVQEYENEENCTICTKK